MNLFFSFVLLKNITKSVYLKEKYDELNILINVNLSVNKRLMIFVT